MTTKSTASELRKTAISAIVEERTKELATANEALRSEIAERKLAEEAVRRAEDRIRLVIDTIPTMAWSLRPDGGVDFVNQRWMEYTGLSLEEALEDSKRIVHPEDLPRAVEKWLPEMAAGNPHEDEMRFRRADGKYRWFLVRIAPLLDERGNLLKWYGVSIDIEDRKQAEMQSRTLIDAIPHQIWSGPPDGTIDYCNGRWRSYTGLELEDLQGNGWRTILHPDDRDRVLEAWHESVVNGTSYEQEERHLGADGKYRWFLARGVPMRDAEGRIVRWYGTNTDIEDGKRAEEALRESETRFRQVAENISEVFWLSNPEATLIHYVSPAYEKIWGRSCESLYAEPSSWMDSIHPDDRRRISEGVRLQSIRGEHDHIYRIVRPDSSLRWIRDRAFPVRDESGKLIRVAGIAEDITERKEAEERLRRSEEKFKALFGIAPVGIAVLDAQRNVVDANPALEQIVRLSKEELLKGIWRRRTYLKTDGTPRPPNEMARARAITENRPINNVETGIVTENGEITWVQLSAAPLALPDASAVVITQDITERKRVELALDERLRFETLLTELSAAFANLPTMTVDQEIDKWLQNIVEFLDLDRAAFDQVGEDGMTLSRSHSHTGRGIDPLPLNVADDQTPWITKQLLRGNMVKWPRIPDEIPEQASKEKEFTGRIGAKSVLSIPVCIGGSVICAISFTSMRVYREWSDEMVARLRLVGEIFANAIARKRAEEALFRRDAELNEAQHLASIGSWEWDILAGGVTCSNEVRRIYGFAREDQNSSDRPFSKFVHPDDRARRSAAIGAALEGGPPYDVEFRIVRPDKSVRFVHSRGQLICDEARKPVRMLGMTQDITERKRAAKELEEANHQLRLLSRRLFEVQEEERRHLARELHDEIGQALTAAKINLQSVTGDGGTANFARLQETTAILDHLLGQVRQISLDLRPSMLDDLGLVPALRSLLDQQGRRASVEVRFSAVNMPEKLDSEIQTTCFRMAQEAITNVVRHADATRIDIDLRCENGKFRLLIRDNGVGFDVESAQAQTVGLGLIGIKERAALIGGHAKIISSPNKGTTIEVSLPLTFRPQSPGRHIGK